MRLTESDESWLQKCHPELALSPHGIAGTINTVATYNPETNLFQILYNGSPDQVGGVRLRTFFGVRLEERADTSISWLPALYVKDVKPTANRHFVQTDHSACLCSPFEEDKFVAGGLAFIPFFEQLVIPFLYGQEFYSHTGRWPWAEYAHGATGLLEAYAGLANSSKVEECFRRILLETNERRRLLSVIQHLSEVQDKTLCFCPRRGHMQYCHPRALQGLRQLRRDLNRHFQWLAPKIGAAHPRHPKIAPPIVNSGNIYSFAHWCEPFTTQGFF